MVKIYPLLSGEINHIIGKNRLQGRRSRKNHEKP
nr:MAG TPA: hypothetical protein [Caudoviricetes sp.]